MNDQVLPRASVRFAAWIVLLVMTLLGAEIIARIVFPLPELRNFDRAKYSPQMVAGPLRGQPTLSHASFMVESAPDGAASVHELNLYGFRDVEWPVSRRASRRVFFVGDSMVEGFLASADETIPKVYERLARAEAVDIEAWNLGIGGAGLTEYVSLIQDAVPAFSPDEVILVLHANDVIGGHVFGAENVKPPFAPLRRSSWMPRLAEVAARAWRGEPVPRRWHSKPFPFFAAVPDPANPWSSNEGTYAPIVAADIAAAMKQGRFNPFNVDELNGFARYLPQATEVRPWLGYIKEFLASRGVRLSVVYFPQTNQTSDHYLPFRQRFSAPGATSLTGPRFQAAASAVAAASQALGVPFLDLTPMVRESEASGRHLYWDYDEHMRPEGYLAVARAIYGWNKGTQGHDTPR